jgi:hypothetical protein
VTKDLLECQGRIKLFERENDRLRLEPQQLQEDFHRQSQEIWRLRAELSASRQGSEKLEAAGRMVANTDDVTTSADDDSWLQRAKDEAVQLRTDLSTCQLDLLKVRELQQKMLNLVSS